MGELLEELSRARQGDVEAYGRVVRRFQDMACGYAYAVLSDFHLAEEVTQEAFIEAYVTLPRLRETAAFASVLRRVVFKHCDRVTRRKRVQTEPLDEHTGVASNAPRPDEAAAKREVHDEVLAVLRSLPDHQREVTTLFYIDGYSQNEIADFLEVPVTTVKKRLHDARNRMKGRLMNMVKETLEQHAPDDRFSKKIVAELLAMPRPLEIEGHPVRQVRDAVLAALPEYELIPDEEILDRTDFVAIGGNPDHVYHVDEGHILRRETTTATVLAMQGRTPPVRIIAAGRVFRPDVLTNERIRLRVYHQLDVLSIEPGVDLGRMQAVFVKAVRAVLGQTEVRWERLNGEFSFSVQSHHASVKTSEGWLKVAGCGLFQPDVLKQAGFNPDLVSGFGFGLGLERLAMAKLGLRDIHDLWRPPYVA